MSKMSTFLKVLVPIIIISVGIVIMQILIATRPEPRKEVQNSPGILVSTIRAERKTSEIIVKATGIVEAAQEVSVIPQVSGRVVYISHKLEVGGFFRTGEILFEIEDTDYRLSLQRAMASRAKAEYELATIESQARIARAEWEQINKDKNIPPNPLVVYEPQLKNAQAALESADASVEQAKLDLERTKVAASFNSRVRSESVDLGQYIRSGNSIAVLTGTDTAEVTVPLPLEELQWIDVPGPLEKRKGAQASVRVKLREKLFEWYGNVVRSTGEIDPQTRMMKLVIKVNDPYGLVNKKSGHPPLALGTFVDVEIRGKELRNAVEIPRVAFRDNATVWLMDENSMLHIRRVVPARIEQNRVIISEGIDDGEMVILTNISGAADGMKLRKTE